MRKEILKAIRLGNVKVFYRCFEWIHKRAEILKRDNYECQRCKDEGKFHVAECVHHKRHLRQHPELALVNRNLASLCLRCHDVEHPEKLKKEVKKGFTNVERWE